MSSDMIEDVDRHLGIETKKPRRPRQAKLPGFSSEQIEKLEAAVEAYQGAKDRMDAAVAAHREALNEATLELIQVMHELKKKTLYVEGVEISVLDLVKVRVKGRKAPKRGDGEGA